MGVECKIRAECEREKWMWVSGKKIEVGTDGCRFSLMYENGNGWRILG